MPTAPTDVAHLLRRAGFGASPGQVAGLVGMEREQLVDWLLDVGSSPAEPPPAVLGDGARSEWERFEGLTKWWLDLMATGSRPLLEKMTLFWHGHFTSEQRKVNQASLMHRQNALLRRNALGDFRVLAKEVALDPAMLRYLDNGSNKKGTPQENWARELWELFLLGPGNYTQADVRESARAWTGHNLDDDRMEYQFRPERHDGGTKTIFGHSAAWSGVEVIDLTLDRDDTGPTCARFVARKLWSFLAYPDPDPALVEGLAQQFRGSGWNIRTLVRAVLLHPEFWSDRARDALLRSPVDYVVAGMKAVGLPAADTNPQWWLPNMGQELFNPPNVAGWRGGASWASATAFWARSSYARHITWKGRDAGVLAGTGEMDATAAVQTAFDRFGIDRPDAHTRGVLEGWVRSQQAAGRWAVQPNLITLCMLTPDFQLA